MFPCGNIGHFHLYMHVSCKAIYTIITKCLYLKNNAISLIFKIWLGMETKLILEMKLSTYSYTYLQVVMVLIRQTVPLYWSSFTPHFLQLNLVFRQRTHLPWSAGVDSLSNLSVLITTDNSITIIFLIYASCILRFDQHQSNVRADFQMRHLTVGVCSLK